MDSNDSTKYDCDEKLKKDDFSGEEVMNKSTDLLIHGTHDDPPLSENVEALLDAIEAFPTNKDNSTSSSKEIKIMIEKHKLIELTPSSLPIKKDIFSGIIFSNFIDFNSEFKMTKILFNHEIFDNILEQIKLSELVPLGIYGDFTEAIKIAETFLGRSLQEEITNSTDLTSNSFEGIYMTVNQNKVVFILKTEESTFNQFPADGTRNLVTYLRFLVDLCSRIVIAAPQKLKFNEEKRFIFGKKINSEMEFQETILEPSKKVSLSQIPQLHNSCDVFLENIQCCPDFGKKFYKSSILKNTTFIEKKYNFKKELLDEEGPSSYNFFSRSQYELTIKEVIRKIKDNWHEKELYFCNLDSQNEFERRMLGLFENIINRSKLADFKEIVTTSQKKYLNDSKHLKRNKATNLKNIALSYFQMILDGLENEKNKSSENENLMAVNIFDLQHKLKTKYGLKELDLKDQKLPTKSYLISKKSRVEHKKLLSEISDLYKESSFELNDNLINELNILRKQILDDFFEKTVHLIHGTEEYFKNDIKINLFNINLIRDTGSAIVNWNCSNTSMNILIQMNVSTRENVFVERVLFVDDCNAFVIIEVEAKQRSLYQVSFLSKTESRCQKIMDMSSSSSSLVINPESKMWCIYNNHHKRFDLGKISKSGKIDDGLPIDVFNKTIEGFHINEILSLTLINNSEQIIFLNQDYKIFEYKYQCKTLQLLAKRENKGGDSLVTTLLAPADKTDYYREIQSSPDGKMIIMRSSTNLDIYDLTWTNILEYKLKSDFCAFKIFSDKISNILCVINRASVECFELTGIVASKVLSVTDLNKDLVKVEGNPIFDFVFHAFKKFGSQSSFIGCPDESVFLFLDSFEKFKKKVIIDYFRLLKIENSRLEYFRKKDDLIEELDEINPISLLDLRMILISRVPIHLATVENFTLMPLQNGKSISQKINSLFSGDQNLNLIQQINELISFGDYEKLLAQIDYPVYVVSICGRQSSGKSYVMNRFFGTRFGVASTRCTDGIWMSTARVKTDDGHKMFIVLDCEGLFSARRTEGEEMKMCLALSAISDIMILNQDLSFNRYLNQLFSNFSRSVGRLKSKHLFRGFLMMLIRDVTTSDSAGAYKELQSNLVQLERDKKNAFLASLFGGKVVSRCLNYFEQEIFNDEIEDARNERFLKLNCLRWKTGQEFLDSLKFTLTQIFIDDDSDMDVYRIKQKLENNTEFCLKNFYNLNLPPGVNQNFKSTFECLGKKIDFEISQKEIILFEKNTDSENEMFKVQDLINKFLSISGSKNEKNHNDLVNNLRKFIHSFLIQRKQIIMDHFDQLSPTDSEFEESVKTSKSKLEILIDNFIRNSSYCDKNCRTCKRVCILKSGHEMDCDCQTSHRCSLVCTINEKCGEQGYQCIEVYGHAGEHRCSEGKHKCSNQCDVETCEFTCSLEMNHENSRKHDCFNKHPCMVKCGAENCTRTCQFDRNNIHENHDCGVTSCSSKCEMCDKNCMFPNHFHSKLISKCDESNLVCNVDGKFIKMGYHCCENQHDCHQLCQSDGVCQVEFTTKEEVWENSHGKFNYMKYIPKESRVSCKVQTIKGRKEHEGIHKCGLNKPHRCNEQCPECSSFCNKDIGHSGPHFTNLHRNKNKSVFLSLSGEKTVSFQLNGDIRTFEAGESCEPENCSSGCSRRGRGHFHLKECKGGDKCDAKISPNVRHSDTKFAHFKDKSFDFWLCKNFWSSHNWEMPVEGELIEKIPLCSFECSSKDHLTEQSFCSLNAWHEGAHKFPCVHPTSDFSKIDIAFVCDTTGSMSSYIEQSKITIKRIMAEFAKRIKETENMKIGFVAYKDHPPQDTTYVTNHRNFTNEADIIGFVNTLSASGGGDGPEAVLDGLNDAVSKLSWRKEAIKYLFHIADAPPHGRDYSGGGGDGFPDGCPCGLKIEDIAVRFRDKGIKYKLLKIGDYPNIMANKFRLCISDFELSDLGHAVKMDEVVSGIISRDALKNDIDYKGS